MMPLAVREPTYEVNIPQPLENENLDEGQDIK